MHSSEQAGYLPHVDGLRMVAVLAVVAFHLAPQAAPGGFTGVDVFFVISGFLISSQILSEIGAGRFSFAKFYMRRVRRILPALFATIAATLVVGFFLLDPARLQALGASAAAATLSVSNFHFWSLAGYFDSGAFDKALLHTWSLSLEEQFYLVWPALLVVFARSRTGLAIFVVLISAASLAAAYVVTARAPEAAFYLLPFRVFEFGLGLGAIGLRGLMTRAPRFVADAMALLGVALIAYAFAAFTAETPFPGWRAAIPCTGAMLLIAVGDKSVLRFILSAPPSAYVGRLSYSLYLTHWPIIVFYGYLTLDAPKEAGDMLLVLGMIGAATLALHYLIERPIHRGAMTARTVAVGSGAVAALIAGVAMHMSFAGGYPWRLTPQTRALFASMQHEAEYRPDGVCHLDLADSIERFDRAACLRPVEGKVNVLLVGDSHAARMLHSLRQVYPEVHVLHVLLPSCRAVLRPTRRGESACPELMRIVFREAIPAGGIDYVVLSSHWRERDVPRLEATLDYLDDLGIGVAVIGPTPVFTNDVPQIMFVGRDAENLQGHLGAFAEPGRSALNTRIRGMSLAHGAQFVDLMTPICPSEARCNGRASDGSVSVDDTHHPSWQMSLDVLGAARRDGRLVFGPRQPAEAD